MANPINNQMLEHERKIMADLVEVSGEKIEEIYIPPGGHMKARTVKAGEVVRFIDPEGNQVPDVILWDAHNLENMLSCANTRTILLKWNIGQGDVLYSKFCDKLAVIENDTVGLHWWGGGFCSEGTNHARYGVPGTPNCMDNLVASMQEYHFARRDIELDSCVSLFMAKTFDADGSQSTVNPNTKPGDYVDFRAMRDIIVGLSNCPQVRNACNGFGLTSIKVVIFKDSKTASYAA
ncbi:MAG: hypothetical protein JWR25_2035 [Noviherbaspirillum sp.]|nr:hypothetical protein [Noviherbaspirillum sp.]